MSTADQLCDPAVANSVLQPLKIAVRDSWPLGKGQLATPKMSMRYPQAQDEMRTPEPRLPRGEPLAARKSLLHTLIDLVGCESAEKMISEFGGTRIWVPVRSTPEAKLTRVLGESAAHALCSHFGGDYLQVPNTITKDDIHRRIAELHRQGCKINDIALAVGRSRRTVFRLLRKKITDLRNPNRSAAGAKWLR